MYWNTRSPALRDSRVREALALAIDRVQLREIAGFPEQIPILDGPVTLGQLRTDEIPEPLGFDPILAGERLDGAGWIDRDGDGIRERDGVALRFTLLVPDLLPHSSVATPMQAMLRRVGVNMELRELEGGVVFQRVEAGEFDAAIRSTGIPADWLSRYFGSESLLGYRNPDVAELIERLAANAVPDVREATYREMTTLFRQNPPALFLFPIVQFIVADRRVVGLSSPWRAQPALHADALALLDEHP